MLITRLSNEEVLASGFTHKAVLSFAQGDFSAAATTQSFALFAPAASQIIDRAARRNAANLVSATATALVGILGDDDDDDGFLTSKSLLTGATPIVAQAGDGALLNQACGKVYNAAGALTFKLTSTTDNINTVTAGEIHVFFRVIDLPSY